MAQGEKKVMIIGLDAPIPGRVYDYAKAGKLPGIASVIENGVFARHCMVPFPTITPPNWTTIVTGAHLGTHGITCFNVHNPGDPLDQTHQGFDTADCQAEYIWNAAEAVGKKAIVINYPSTWPPTMKDGWQIAGAGLSMNEWRYGTPASVTLAATLSMELLFATEEYPQGTVIELKPASGWEAMPKCKAALEAELRVECRSPRYPVEPVTWYLLAVDSGDGYDRVIVADSKNASSPMADLRVGQWTPNIVREFQTEQGPKKAVFRMKLLELSRDGKTLKLYVSPIGALSGWSYPESLAEEIKSENGLPAPHPGFRALIVGWIDHDTFIETLDLAHTWLADAATHCLATKDWTIYVMHIHTPDHFHHGFATQMDPATSPDEKTAKSFQELEMRMYQSIDRAIQRILEYADENTTVVIVSDHGAKATTGRFNVAKVLEDAGLLVRLPGEEGKPGPIDWSKTKAVQQRSCYIYVNVKGRDPQGIVEPGEEYEKVRDQIIAALHNYVDPETGKRPVTLALRREDARIIGLYGDRVGDVVYAISGDFGGQHGPQLPTTKFSLGDIGGLFMMRGPGVKKGEILERTVMLEDVVPTVCYLADLPVPKHAEGGILYQALVDSNAKLTETERLRRNYERLQKALEAEKALTHTYNE